MANAAQAAPDPTLISIASGPPTVGAGRRVVPQSVRVFLGSPLTAIGVAMFAIIVFAAFFAPLLARYAPLDMVGPLGSGPSASHPFGTNDQGQDIFSQAVYGARFSLAVGLGAGVAITVTSTVLGMLAAY